MSDTFITKFSSDNPWLKVYAYLMYRNACRGLWLDTTPKDWVEYIFDYSIIDVRLVHDSGGGQGGFFSIKVYRGDHETILYSFKCSYYSSSHNLYIEHLKNEAISYMKSYGQDIVKDTFDPKTVAFNKTFETDIGMLKIANKYLKGYSIPELFHIFKLLATLYDISYNDGYILDIELRGHMKTGAEAAKIFAFLAWMDMEREFYSGC